MRWKTSNALKNIWIFACVPKLYLIKLKCAFFKVNKHLNCDSDLKITSLIFKSPDLNLLDYHVRWNTATLHTQKPINIPELKTALLQYGMICHRSSLIRQSSHFERDFDFVLLQLADTLNTQFKYREGSWHSLLKRPKCWRKSCAKFDLLLRKTYWIFRTRLHVHLKKTNFIV